MGTITTPQPTTAESQTPGMTGPRRLFRGKNKNPFNVLLTGGAWAIVERDCARGSPDGATYTPGRTGMPRADYTECLMRVFGHHVPPGLMEDPTALKRLIAEVDRRLKGMKI